MISYKQTLLFILGSSSMIYILITGQRLDLLDIFSPAPVVFSYGRDFYKREQAFSFVLINTNGDRERFRLTRSTYREIKGPHHYKLLFYHFLIKSSHNENPQYEKFINYFFCNRILNNSPIKTVELHKHKRVNTSYECTKD